MEKEKIDSVKGFISSLEENMGKLKLAMKKGDGEEFNNLKQDSINLTKKIEQTLPTEKSTNKK